MKADSTTLVDFLSQNKTLFKIPVYQRNYEWGENQCKQLFNDLIKSIEINSGHFIGTVVYVPESGEKMSHIDIIIDGQQRLTSCMLLLCALAKSDSNISNEITENLIMNKFVSMNDHIKLQSVDSDKLAFRAVVNDLEYSHPSKIVQNYQFFKKLISESKYTPQQLFEGLNFLNMVYIDLDGKGEAENPQIIFESLNSTGLSLSYSDLIRNFLLMSLDSNDQEKLYKDYWLRIESLITNKDFDGFVRNYLIMKTNRIVAIKNVYSTYKHFYSDNDFNSETALIDLYENAKNYDKILNANSESNDFNRIMRHINILDKKVVYPYFMKLLDMQSSSKITWSEINEIAHVIESFLYRRMVCSVPSNGLNTIFIGLTGTSKNDSELSILQKRFINVNFPDDKMFRDNLIDYPIYDRKPNWAKLSLVVIEEHKTKETIDFEDAQVEHIMPQKLSDDWKIDVPNADSINRDYGNTIGNLTLTKYNQELSNKTFDEKRAYYSQSNVLLTRELSNNYDDWNKNSIISRTNELARELIQIFPKLGIFSKFTIADLSGEHLIDENIDVTGTKPIRLTIQGHSIKVSSWKYCLVEFLNYVWQNDTSTYYNVKNDYSVSKALLGSARSPKVLSNGETIDTNHSAKTIVALISKMSEICGISDEVSYTLR